MDGGDTAAAHTPAQADEPQSAAKPSYELTLPITRVKRIIKQDGEVKAISTDGNYVIAKAAEMLIDELVEGASDKTLRADRNLLSYADVADTVHEFPKYGFLKDIIPRKAQAAQLLQELQRLQGGQ